VLIKLEVNCSKISKRKKDACVLSNWLQVNANIIFKETVCVIIVLMNFQQMA
jgi:hypothetical protein